MLGRGTVDVRCVAGTLSGTRLLASAKPIARLEGCWEGRGDVMGKAVTVAITAKPIVRIAMMAVDAESRALADARDMYSAHLIFGGTKKAETTAEPVIGFWTDSFGGGFAASGRGASVADGFDVTYPYPDSAIVNRWRLNGSQLSWAITMRDAKGIEAPFASYALSKTGCQPLRA